MMTKALEGDVGAARLLLERAVAPLKPAEQAVTLRLAAGTLTTQGQSILDSVGRGELGVGQGAQLIASLGALAKITEIDELAKRIEKLEEKQNGKS
jgi:HAMP domain-containing protein